MSSTFLNFFKSFFSAVVAACLDTYNHIRLF
nr:MAG TPA: hypothetical protein [Caudoviricetes sp.]